MASAGTRHEELVGLSRWLGDPVRDCAMLGEGNTSTRLGEDSFLVKASGFELATIGTEGFVEVNFARALAMLDSEASDEAVAELLDASKVDQSSSLKPSVETTLHAVCLSLPGVEFVAHSHPTAINAFTCSVNFEELLGLCLFPDQIVVCGANPLLIPYVDPGVPLACALRDRMEEHQQRYGRPAKAIYLQNHGFIALGASVRQAQAITLMAIKAARILAGAIASGGVNPMSAEDVQRIDGRSDEHYRQRIIERQMQQDRS